VVSTAKGIEGLQVVDGVHYLSAETPDEFAAAIELLDRDRARAAAITDAATALVGEQYSIPALEAVIRDLLSGSAVDRATR
jgi:hypothetical protein